MNYALFAYMPNKTTCWLIVLLVMRNTDICISRSLGHNGTDGWPTGTAYIQVTRQRIWYTNVNRINTSLEIDWLMARHQLCNIIHTKNSLVRWILSLVGINNSFCTRPTVYHITGSAQAFNVKGIIVCELKKRFNHSYTRGIRPI